jgi:hypothetical protein
VYPVFALSRRGKSSRTPADAEQRFLADGGLRDNSGLASLHQQIAAEFYWHYHGGVPKAPVARLALAFWIDAAVSNVGFRSAHEWRRDGYAWRDTYLGQGQDSVGAAIDLHENAVRHDLELRGWLFFDHINPLLDMLRIDTNPVQVRRLANSNWSYGDGGDALALSPLIIALRLKDAPSAAYGSIVTTRS